ncbi:unnamed protein product [Choristocarpus tenellus]
MSLSSVQSFDLDTGGLVGALGSVEGTGLLLTGTRNDEIAHRAAVQNAEGKTDTNRNSCQDRLTVHTIQDAEDPSVVLGFGVGMDAGGSKYTTSSWESAAIAFAEHPAAVTGMVVLTRERVGWKNDIVLTSGGDGWVVYVGLEWGGVWMSVWGMGIDGAGLLV